MHENFVKRYLCRQKTAIKKCSRLVGKLMYLNTISIYVNVKKNLKRTKKIFLQCKYIGGQKTNDIRVTFIDITVFDEDVSSHFVWSNIWGQFHQPYGAKHKCASSLFYAIQFHQQNYAQLYQNTQIDVTSNFYAVLSAPYASKFNVSLLVPNLLVKW